ncbi:hypothetical protein [Moorena producens]|uniref:hypothetical protein n=1 Tax=Moorena producens TaxID=1155739 RepID=UPI003C796E30
MATRGAFGARESYAQVDNNQRWLCLGIPIPLRMGRFNAETGFGAVAQPLTVDR